VRPKEMTNGELADALEAVAAGRSQVEPPLPAEAAARLRTHLEVRGRLSCAP